MVEFLAEGKTLRDLARALGASDCGIHYAKQTAATKILEYMGNGIQVEVRALATLARQRGREPGTSSLPV